MYFLIRKETDRKFHRIDFSVLTDMLPALTCRRCFQQIC
uniref:Uncharacterized protein n=1 Tax=Leclercia adecarboxylata TaxID=83655 RepID=A0A5B8KQY0_9ENTR|nr:Hypothetical protein [Leclercia adecarboxylata]